MPKMVPELSPIEVKRLCHPGKGRTPCSRWAVRGLGSCRYGRGEAAGHRSGGLSRRDARPGARAGARGQGSDLAGHRPYRGRKAVRAALTAAQRRGLTFSDAFGKYAEAKLTELGTDADRTRWKSSVERYAVPHIGDLLVNDLTVQDMLRVLEPIWHDKTETASRVRSRIEAILSWATVAGHRTGDNPARWRGSLDTLLPKPGRIADKGNHPAIALDEVAPWFKAMRHREGVGAQALAVLALCACRSGEVRGMTWDEIDTKAKIWTISAERMKADKEHRVPLTDQALAIIEAMPRLADSPLVFAAPRGGQLSDMNMSKVMRDMQARAEKAAQEAGLDPERAGWRDSRSGRPAVPHGLRSTFRDWAAERTDYPRDMAEIALAHAVGSEVERAYRRGDMIEKRRAMMADWAKFLEAV